MLVLIYCHMALTPPGAASGRLQRERSIGQHEHDVGVRASEVLCVHGPNVWLNFIVILTVPCNKIGK